MRGWQGVGWESLKLALATGLCSSIISPRDCLRASFHVMISRTGGCIGWESNRACISQGNVAANQFFWQACFSCLRWRWRIGTHPMRRRLRPSFSKLSNGFWIDFGLPFHRCRNGSYWSSLVNMRVRPLKRTTATHGFIPMLAGE